MSPIQRPEKEIDEKYFSIIGKFVSDIRNRKLEGSNNVAFATLTMIEQIIGESQNPTAYELCNLLRAIGRKVHSALPSEFIISNMIRRVLRAIRDESRAHINQSGEGAGESLQRLVLAAPSRRATLGSNQLDLKEPIRDHIAEIRTELESATSSICSQSREHLQADELVLTFGSSTLVEKFLKAAASRKYRLILAEGTDIAKSHGMAQRLSTAGVPTTVINSAAVYAIMPRVNKVVIGCRAALGGGGVLTEAGVNAVTCAAKHYSVPVLVLTPLHKMVPLHGDKDRTMTVSIPKNTLSYERCNSISVQVYAPTFDFLLPEHISLFITNLGGSSPSYTYRLLSELYDPKDYQM